MGHETPTPPGQPVWPLRRRDASSTSVRMAGVRSIGLNWPCIALSSFDIGRLWVREERITSAACPGRPLPRPARPSVCSIPLPSGATRRPPRKICYGMNLRKDPYESCKAPPPIQHLPRHLATASPCAGGEACRTRWRRDRGPPTSTLPPAAVCVVPARRHRRPLRAVILLQPSVGHRSIARLEYQQSNRAWTPASWTAMSQIVSLAAPLESPALYPARPPGSLSPRRGVKTPPNLPACLASRRPERIQYHVTEGHLPLSGTTRATPLLHRPKLKLSPAQALVRPQRRNC